MIRTVTMAVCLATAVAAQSQRYSIQPNDTNRLELQVAKTGLYRGKVHVFLFPQYQGRLVFDATKPESSQVGLTLSAGAIKLTDTWLSANDFKSVREYALKDMLDARKFPEISFASSEVRTLDPTHFDVRGLLTIRGVAKPSTIRVMLEPGPPGALRFRGDAVIRLTDYGLKPPKAALGLIGTENEMKFSFSIIAEPERDGA